MLVAVQVCVATRRVQASSRYGSLTDIASAQIEEAARHQTSDGSSFMLRDRGWRVTPGAIKAAGLFDAGFTVALALERAIDARDERPERGNVLLAVICLAMGGMGLFIVRTIR